MMALTQGPKHVGVIDQ